MYFGENKFLKHLIFQKFRWLPISLIFFLFARESEAQFYPPISTPTWAWGKNFNPGSTVPPIMRFKDGYLYTAGNFNATFTMETQTIQNNGGNDIYLAKWDISGNLIWVKTISQIGNQYVADIQVNNYEIVLAGKFDSISLQIDSLSVTSIGGFDIFTAKYDLNGNPLSLHRYGTSGNDYIGAICLDFDNNLYLAKGSVAKISNSGTVIWDKPFKANQIFYSAVDSSIIIDAPVAFYTFTSGAGAFTNLATDFGVHKLSLNGDSIWYHLFTNINPPLYSNSVSCYNESDGSYFLGFVNYSKLSFWHWCYIHKISSDGTTSYAYSGMDQHSELNFRDMSSNKNYLSFSLGGGNKNGTFILDYNTNVMYKKYRYMPSWPKSHLFLDTNLIFAHGSNDIQFHTLGKFGKDTIFSSPTNTTLHKCLGSNVTLIGNISGAVGNVNYSWSPTTGLSSTDTISTSFVADTNITYILTMTDQTGQIAKDTFNIIIDTLLQTPIITPQFIPYCGGSMTLYSNSVLLGNWLRKGTNPNQWYYNNFPNSNSLNTPITQSGK